MHVCDASDGVEHLRFDCFENEPHYHYINTVEQGNLICRIDEIAEGDPVEWTVGRLRERLPEMLDPDQCAPVGRCDSKSIPMTSPRRLIASPTFSDRPRSKRPQCGVGSSGQTWTQQSPATVPFARYGAEAAYLATVGGGGGTVMFGGTNLLYQLLETWVWDGGLKTWTQISVPNGTGPAARTGHVMASSPTLVLLFGGQGTNSQFNDTWTFNGTTWAKLSPATSPSVRSSAVMAYDTAGSRWVLFGGENEYNYLPETWTFDGTTWTQLAVANGAGPSGRIGAQMAYDSQSGFVTLFGGISATSNYPSNETWQLQSNTWVQL